MKRNKAQTVSLITSGRIAKELEVSLHRVLYVLATRLHIAPVARAGNLRLFHRKAIAKVRHELQAIEARKYSIKAEDRSDTGNDSQEVSCGE